MKRDRKTLGKFAGLLFIFVCAVLFCYRTNGSEPEFFVPEEQTESVIDSVAAENLSEEHSEDPEEGSSVTVYVCGHVARPGVYTLSGSPRLYDFLTEAGGFDDEALDEAVNLAALAEDGQMLRIPGADEYDIPETDGPYGVDDKDDGRVNINTAGEDALMSIPGIGKSKADSIIRYRENEGAFKSTEDIMNIPGIKEGVYNKIKDHIKV